MYKNITFIVETLTTGGSLTVHKGDESTLEQIINEFKSFVADCPPNKGHTVKYSITFTTKNH